MFPYASLFAKIEDSPRHNHRWQSEVRRQPDHRRRPDEEMRAHTLRAHPVQQYGKRKSLRDLRHPSSGQIVLNGAAAFQGKTGDVLTIMSFAHVPKRKVQRWKPRVIVLGKRNRIVKERGI